MMIEELGIKTVEFYLIKGGYRVAWRKKEDADFTGRFCVEFVA